MTLENNTYKNHIYFQFKKIYICCKIAIAPLVATLRTQCEESNCEFSD